MKRLQQCDWLRVGLRLLAEQGVSALTIENLCTILGVTKGSFYHHFQGFAEFKTALLAFFEQEDTLHVIALSEERQTPAQKLLYLLGLIAQQTHAVEVALARWAHHDAEVRCSNASTTVAVAISTSFA